MNIKDALYIFKITDIHGYTTKDIKKIYRRLMIEYHPDVGGSEDMASKVNEAYGLISDTMRNIKAHSDTISSVNMQKRECLIELDKLILIYKGEKVSVNTTDGVIMADISSLSEYKILIKANIKVLIGENETYRTVIFAHRHDDTYSVWLDIDNNNENTDNIIEVSILNKGIKAEMSSKQITFKFTFDANIVLNVTLERDNSNG